MTKVQIGELEHRAMEHIQSVSYSVSLRWVFYRLLQDGIYGKKGDYDRWCMQASKFRHNGTWPPDILEDTTRPPTKRGLSRMWTNDEIIEHFTDPDRLAAYFQESHFTRQAHYVELWFEARAMLGQFEKYTREIVLRPFGGMYSIPMKYQAAREVGAYAARFKTDAVILYFGDSDDAGHTIFDASTTGEKGFTKWCSADVEVVWCGLNVEQARRYGVPEDPDHPGKFQWEALSDSQAKEIITTGVSTYVDDSLIDDARKRAVKKGKALSKKLKAALAAA